MVELMKLKFQKRSKLKLVSRIIPPQAEDIADILDIPEANNLNTQRAPWGHYRPSGINMGLIPRLLGRSSLGYPAACGGVVDLIKGSHE